MTTEVLSGTDRQKEHIANLLQRTNRIGEQFRQELVAIDHTTPNGVTALGAGLSHEQLMLATYQSSRLQQQGIEVPLIPTTSCSHLFEGSFRTGIVQMRESGLIPKYSESFIDLEYNRRYTIWETSRVFKASDAPFIPGSGAFLGVGGFEATARNDYSLWGKAFQFDSETGEPIYTNGSFQAKSEELTGTFSSLDRPSAHLSLDEIAAVRYTLAYLHKDFPYDKVEKVFDENITQRIKQARPLLHQAEHIYARHLQEEIVKLCNVMRQSDSGAWVLHKIPTRGSVGSVRVDFIPSLGSFSAKNSAVPTDLKMKLYPAALIYLSAKIAKDYDLGEISE